MLFVTKAFGKRLPVNVFQSITGKTYLVKGLMGLTSRHNSRPNVVKGKDPLCNEEGGRWNGMPLEMIR
jgi:hypothetical protein